MHIVLKWSDTLKVLLHLLQDFYSTSDHFGTRFIKVLNLFEYQISGSSDYIRIFPNLMPGDRKMAIRTINVLCAQNGQTQFKNLAAHTVRFLKSVRPLLGR